jgi:hypothetical protein
MSTNDRLWPPRRRLVAALLFCSVSAFGCASYHGYPNRYSNVKKDLDALALDFSGKQISACEQAREKACRDLITNSAIRAIDLQFDDFRQQLFRSSGAINLGSDIAVLGLSAGGALLVPATTKAILAAISGVVTGSKASIDKNLLYDKTVLIMLGRMEALRKDQFLLIQKGLRTEWNSYPLSAALVDVEGYYNVGTIPAAINSINAQTGQKLKETEDELKALR